MRGGRGKSFGFNIGVPSAGLNLRAFTGMAIASTTSFVTMVHVAVIPGMAFDREGHRLGRGKGYYDRFLNRVKTYKIGVCFDFQMMDQLPHDPHDVMMDEIIY